MTKTYIVTPNFGINFLPKYFETLFSQTDKEFKVVFVDNTLNNDAVDFIHKNWKSFLPKLIIIKNKNNPSFAKSMNQGIYEAFKDKDCKYIISLNNDVALDKNFVKKLIECAEKRKDAGSIQPLMLWGDTGLIDDVGLLYSKNSLCFGRGGYEKYSKSKFNKEEEIIGCCAGACLYFRKALQDVEIRKVVNSKKVRMFFDEDFDYYYEDVDLALRLQWFGYKSYYSPKSIVKHYKNITPSKQKIYYGIRNSTINLYKNFPKSFIIKNLLLIFTAEVAQIIFNLIKLNPIVLKSKFDAYSMIIRGKLNAVERKVPLKNLEKHFVLKWRP